jgi:hypothetical protein
MDCGSQDGIGVSCFRVERLRSDGNHESYARNSGPVKAAPFQSVPSNANHRLL